MSGTTLLVIADPSAPFLQFLSGLLDRVKVVIANDSETLRRKAPEADVLLFAQGRVPDLDEILALGKRVRWMHSFYTGVEGLMTPALKAHPAPLTNGRGVFRAPLADWVTAAMLYFAFDFRRLIQQQEAGMWQPFTGTLLTGRTLGVVGYGSIGQEVAARARQFGMRIVALRRRPEISSGDDQLDAAYGPDQIGRLMASSDYVVAVLPKTPETTGLIGARELAAMKPTAVVINIGRGPAIDEAALIQALQAGKIRGAALDVFTTEPLPAGHPFYKMKNVLLSPHTADRVEGFLEPAVQCFLGNLHLYLSGQPLENVVDKHAGY